MMYSKCWKEKHDYLRILYLAKLFFKNGEEKIFFDKQRLRELITNRLTFIRNAKYF